MLETQVRTTKRIFFKNMTYLKFASYAIFTESTHVYLK